MKKILIIILILLSIFSFVRHQRRAPKRNYSDFHIFYVTGERILNKEDIYIPEDQEYAEFKYSPLFALFMVPFALFNERIADLIWYLMNFSLLFLIFKLGKDLIVSRPLGDRKIYLFYTLSFIMMLRFIFLNLDVGQPNILMLAILLLGFKYYFKNKDIACGLLISLSVMIKYTPLLVIPYFLYKKRWKLILVIIISFIVFTALSGFLLKTIDPNVSSLSLQEQILYLKRSCFNRETLIMDYKNQSLIRYMFVFFSPTTYGIEFFKFSKEMVLFFIIAIILFLYALIFIPPHLKDRIAKEKELDMLNLSFLVSYIAFLNPNGWLPGYIFLMLAYMVCIYYLLVSDFKDITVLFLLWIAFFFHSLTSGSMLKLILKEGAYLSQYAAKPVSRADLYGWVTLAVIPLLIAFVKIKFSKRFRGTDTL